MIKNLAIIAAIGENNELGRDGRLVFDIPGDLAFFKKTTMGAAVIMGLNTWVSLPMQLPGRQHFVLALPNQVVPQKVKKDGSKTILEEYNFDNTSSLYSNLDVVWVVRDMKRFVAEFPVKDRAFVIGGASIYRQFLPLVNEMYLTEVAATAEADAFFPDFDKRQWIRTELGEGSDGGLKYTHNLYQRKEKK